MQFQQAQLRHTVGISIETFRHWKRVLPPFSRFERAAKYTLSDLLAAAIFHRLTAECGVRAGALSVIAEAVVAICATHTWARLEGGALIINIAQAKCHLVSRNVVASTDGISVICPLAPIIGSLREALTRTRPAEAQDALAFPPTVVSEMRFRGRRRA